MGLLVVEEMVARFQEIVEGEAGFVHWLKRGRFGSLPAYSPVVWVCWVVEGLNRVVLGRFEVARKMGRLQWWLGSSHALVA